MFMAEFIDKRYEYGIAGPDHVAICRRHGANAPQHDIDAKDGNQNGNPTAEC
jgi:hypothetical protein